MATEAGDKIKQNTAWQRVAAFAQSPAGVAIVTFLLTGLAATFVSKWLDDMSKARELDLAAHERAVESVREITNLLYERRTRANMLSSAILRGANLDEIKDRKKSYDDVFVRYNATLQSNMFRIREIFHTSDYTIFESILEGPVRKDFVMDDNCLTGSYDAALSSDTATRGSAALLLSKCPVDGGVSMPISQVHATILDCEYAFTDALYRIVQNSQKGDQLARLTNENATYIRKQCAPH
jgi:hypothetical protein